MPAPERQRRQQRKGRNCGFGEKGRGGGQGRGPRGTSGQMRGSCRRQQGRGRFSQG